jgi:predicted outer membrane repeat protein
MLRKVNTIAVAAVMAAGTGGGLTAVTAQAAQAAQATPAVAVPCRTGALVSAVASAPSGATLSLAARCVYNLKAALPQVSHALFITGNGATLQRSFAKGTPSFTLVTVAGSGFLTVSDLNFRHGGGAIAVIDLGQLTVNGGTFTGNSAADGGAISSDASIYAPQINHARFIRNTATGSGGAIYNYSSGNSVNVTNSVFTGNRAAEGGAIWEYGFGGVITGSTFQRNSAGAGGALYIDEDFAEKLTGVVIRRNSARGDGGGIYVEEGGEGAVLDNSTVSGNRAGGRGGGFYDGEFQQSSVSGSAIEGNRAAEGAGVYNDASTQFELAASTVSGNHASGDGGGIYNADRESGSVTTSTVSGNHAGGHGGGIYNKDSVTLAVAGTHITGNRAPGGGGGIFNDGPDADVTVTSSPVTGNKPDNCEPPGSIAGCTG